MCQQGAAECEYVRASEIEKIHVEYEDHLSGKSPRTDEELQDMAVRMLVLKY